MIAGYTTMWFPLLSMSLRQPGMLVKQQWHKQQRINLLYLLNLIESHINSGKLIPQNMQNLIIK